MRRLLFILMLPAITIVQAQTDTIKSFADLPALLFETTALKTNDTTAINQWLKTVAATDAVHVDSILAHEIVLDTSTWFWLRMMKSLYQFVNNDWGNLQNADTIFRHVQYIPNMFRVAGFAELSSFAKARLSTSNNFNAAYFDDFKQSVNTLSKDDIKNYLGYVLGIMNTAQDMYETRLKEFRDTTAMADTLMGRFFREYVYSRLKVAGYDSLYVYVNDVIKNSFTKADTLRGSITPERAWWDVLHYSITVKPDYVLKTLSGSNVIRYKVISNVHPNIMQIDLQDSLLIDSILFNQAKKLHFKKEGNAWFVAVPEQNKSSVDSVTVFYHGKVHEAVNAPWDGGWVFTKDSLGNPWMSVACEGFGASVWFPCKDHLSDEPDNGASVTLIVPDTLAGVSNGRLLSTQKNNDGTISYTWGVVNPINSYDITAYIGKYVNFNEVYDGLKGKLDVSFWALDYNEAQAKQHMLPEVNRMLKAFEYWMGPYPFYEDSYKLVQSSYAGMEHQSAVADGNGFVNGYMGYDNSGTGWGMKWDYMIVHESGHEWFGNNITDKDITDMWLHEGFTMYSETLFTEYYYGKEAANDYTVGNRSNIANVFPVIGFYNVNDEVDSRNQDMYYKGSNFLQTIRHSINNDSLFRNILIGLNKKFYHQTVTTTQVENYINQHAGFNYHKVFDQYLRNASIPQFEYYFNADSTKVFYRYTNCIAGFNLPLVLQNKEHTIKIIPTGKWQSVPVTPAQKLFNADSIKKMYYINVKNISMQ